MFKECFVVMSLKSVVTMFESTFHAQPLAVFQTIEAAQKYYDSILDKKDISIVKSFLQVNEDD